LNKRLLSLSKHRGKHNDITMTDPYQLEEYIEAHATTPDAVLQELYRHTHLHEMNPRMMSGPVQGKFLQLLCQMLKPQRALEIGTYTGYAAICIARGLPEGGKLVTIEANREYENTLRQYFDKAQVTEKIELILGDAKAVIPVLNDAFDFVFIDADKVSYPTYYNIVMEKVRPGGFILADNVLWDGKVLNAQTKERDTQALIAFNDMVQNDPRVENVLLPIRDGLMMIRVAD
jgi:predicted O-methyltransferase YrrM